MNLLEKIVFQEEKPSVYSNKKTEKQQQIVIALGENAVLKKHTTSVPATLYVLKGELTFNMNNENTILKELDVFEIPVDVEHEVTGNLSENLFLIIKEL